MTLKHPNILPCVKKNLSYFNITQIQNYRGSSKKGLIFWFALPILKGKYLLSLIRLLLKKDPKRKCIISFYQCQHLPFFLLICSHKAQNTKFVAYITINGSQVQGKLQRERRMKDFKPFTWQITHILQENCMLSAMDQALFLKIIDAWNFRVFILISLSTSTMYHCLRMRLHMTIVYSSCFHRMNKYVLYQKICVSECCTQRSIIRKNSLLYYWLWTKNLFSSRSYKICIFCGSNECFFTNDHMSFCMLT